MFSGADSFALVALTLLGHASAHMILKMPVPYGKPTSSPLTDVKIGASESNFPCQLQLSNISATWEPPSEPNLVTAGKDYELAFSGSASHGGGTCQLAISLDEQPTAKSTWKIIQVYEGGCPTSGDGNDGSDPFTYSVPTSIPNGKVTFAWLWYNKVGNREVYMNCAPLTVSGGAEDDSEYSSLPNMYVINLPTSECSTVETSDQEIPNPGQFIQKAQVASIKAATGPSCAASAAAQTEGVTGYKTAALSNGAGYSAPAGGAGATAAAGSGASQATSAASSASGYNNGQYSSPASSSAAGPAYSTAAAAAASSSEVISSAPTTTAYSAAPAYSSVAASYEEASSPAAYPTLSVVSGAGISGPATASGYAPVGTGSSSSSSSSTGSSSSSGILCDASHSGQYGVAVNGKTVWRAVASGTSCDEVAAYRKRSLLRHAHVRRHVQSGGHV